MLFRYIASVVCPADGVRADPSAGRISTNSVHPLSLARCSHQTGKMCPFPSAPARPPCMRPCPPPCLPIHLSGREVHILRLQMYAYFSFVQKKS